MEDESLYFSSIEKNEIAEQVSEPINTTVVTYETQNELEKTVEIITEEINLKSQISNLKSEKPKRELPKTSSIGSMFKEIHKEVITEKDENKVVLSTENVLNIWNEFLAESKDKLQNAFMSAAQEQVPILIEDKVTFTASNNISLEMLQLHKMDITAYFRKRTTSTTVVPTFILKRDENQQKNYKTTKDRLKDMIAANNSVLKLIEKLDLNEY